jgi:hypothetical protein
MDGKKKHRSTVNFTQNVTLKQRDLQSGHQNLIYSLLVGKWKTDETNSRYTNGLLTLQWRMRTFWQECRTAVKPHMWPDDLAKWKQAKWTVNPQINVKHTENLNDQNKNYLFYFHQNIWEWTIIDILFCLAPCLGKNGGVTTVSRMDTSRIRHLVDTLLIWQMKIINNQRHLALEKENVQVIFDCDS